MKISICGKGGSGKSTLTNLLARQAVARGFNALVVDSDESNSGLYRLLGFENPPSPLMELTGGKKSLKKKMGQPSVLSENQIAISDIPQEYIQRKNGLMLVSIGKILQALEGCACPMGVLSREFLRKLRLKKDEIAFIDMEAGVEHFGRGVDNSIDTILFVAEPSFESLILAERVKDIATGIQKKCRAILNKVNSPSLEEKLKQELTKRKIEVIGTIQNDQEIFEAALDGRPLGPVSVANEVEEILDFLLSEH